MAHIVNQSFQLKEHITTPLMPDNESYFRLFLGDIGVFSYQSGINAASFVSSERENTLSGIIFEYAIKVSKNNYGYSSEQKLLTIPFYFIPFVAQDLADGTMKV